MKLDCYGDQPWKSAFIRGNPRPIWEKHLRRQVQELGIGGAVVFAGYVEHIQVPDYLAAADLFAFAFRSEVQPLSVEVSGEAERAER